MVIRIRNNHFFYFYHFLVPEKRNTGIKFNNKSHRNKTNLQHQRRPKEHNKTREDHRRHVCPVRQENHCRIRERQVWSKRQRQARTARRQITTGFQPKSKQTCWCKARCGRTTRRSKGHARPHEEKLLVRRIDTAEVNQSVSRAKHNANPFAESKCQVELLVHEIRSKKSRGF